MYFELLQDSHGDFVYLNPVLQYVHLLYLVFWEKQQLILILLINSDLIKRELFYYEGFQGFQCTKCPDSMLVIIIKDNYEQYFKQTNK